MSSNKEEEPDKTDKTAKKANNVPKKTTTGRVPQKSSDHLLTATDTGNKTRSPPEQKSSKEILDELRLSQAKNKPKGSPSPNADTFGPTPEELEVGKWLDGMTTSSGKPLRLTRSVSDFEETPQVKTSSESFDSHGVASLRMSRKPLFSPKLDGSDKDAEQKHAAPNINSTVHTVPKGNKSRSAKASPGTKKEPKNSHVKSKERSETSSFLLIHCGNGHEEDKKTDNKDELKIMTLELPRCEKCGCSCKMDTRVLNITTGPTPVKSASSGSASLDSDKLSELLREIVNKNKKTNSIKRGIKHKNTECKRSNKDAKQSDTALQDKLMNSSKDHPGQTPKQENIVCAEKPKK